MSSITPTRIIRAVFVIILVAILVVVAYLVFFDGLLSPDSTAAGGESVTVLQQAPEPIPMVEQEIWWQDNFNGQGGVWELSPGGEAGYENNSLVLSDTNVDGDAWARPHLMFDNFLMNVDMQWLGGSVGGNYGVRFRVVDEENFYAIYFRNDGWYTIGRMVDGRWRVIHQQFAGAINRSGGLNRLQIEANGSHLRFFINGAYLVDIGGAGTEIGDIMFVANRAEGTEFFTVGYDDLVTARYPIN